MLARFVKTLIPHINLSRLRLSDNRLLLWIISLRFCLRPKAKQTKEVIEINQCAIHISLNPIPEPIYLLNPSLLLYLPGSNFVFNSIYWSISLSILRRPESRYRSCQYRSKFVVVGRSSLF